MSADDGQLSALFQIAAWKAELDEALPSPLKETEAWLTDVEELVEEGLPTSQNYSEAVPLIQEKMSLFKVGKQTCGNLDPLLGSVLEEDCILESRKYRVGQARYSLSLWRSRGTFMIASMNLPTVIPALGGGGGGRRLGLQDPSRLYSKSEASWT